MANIPATMPRYSLFLDNQRKRVRYPETLDLSDVDAAQRVARRVADVFMEVVPYWDELTPEQQNRYAVEIMDEAGGLLLTVPFMETEEARADQPETRRDKEKEALPDGSTDRAGKCQEE
ncbi:hypothetical protein ILT44_22085 [Microvirga sp. BT689]|uniref:DUF6894 family protein n=1 Tax=Microvirga arvi TaxID=2778731 RepID=UPI00194F24CF|nr:hypothetical protein [Microvirga arvi]MBM6582899.1 hypothetical protein [Microvirga arvi]